MKQDSCNNKTGQTKDSVKETAAMGKQAEVCKSAVLMLPVDAIYYLVPVLLKYQRPKDQNTGKHSTIYS